MKLYLSVIGVAMVNLFLNILPTLALRYDTPKLCAMLERMNRLAR